MGCGGSTNDTTKKENQEGGTNTTQQQKEPAPFAQGVNVLVVTASSRTAEKSTSKKHALAFAAGMKEKYNANVTIRDTSDGSMVFVDDAMVDSYFAQGERTEAQKKAVEVSDKLVDEIKANDVIFLAVPIYNFAAPASFKAYCDLIARAGLTFQYTADGPKGLLEGKKAYAVITSGGTPLESPFDHLSSWLKLFFGFIGVSDLTIIDSTTDKGEEAKAQIAALTA